MKTDINNEILIKAVKKLQLRFPVAEIERATGYGKGSISNFLNSQKPVSDKFLETFSKAFNIDLREFGYTKGLERVSELIPEHKDNEGLKDKLIQNLERYVRRLEDDIDRMRNDKQ
jgi:transcriptional regulator with XRE-family HTH domain